MPDPDWLAALLAATGPRLRTFPLRPLQRLLTALPELGCQPDADWCAAQAGS